MNDEDEIAQVFFDLVKLLSAYSSGSRTMLKAAVGDLVENGWAISDSYWDAILRKDDGKTSP